jgi:hypothetical protein
MRTTVTIDDKLLELVKDRAREEGTTLGGLMERSLRRYLATPTPTTGPPIPVFRGGGGFRPGIDPSSNASMFDAADEEDLEAQRG